MNFDRTLQIQLLELATTERVLSSATPEKITPEQRQLDALETTLQRTREAAGSAQMAVDDMENEILRIQEDERKLRRRERDDREQLRAEIDPERRKDLEHDRYATKSRINDLLYELKEAHNEIHALRNNLDVHGAQVDELVRQVEAARRAAEAANAAAEMAETAGPQHRAHELRAALPSELVALYDAQKDDNDVGVAAFSGRACGGCHIVLPAASRQSIATAPETEMPQCPNCGSYLVRVSG